MYNAFIIFIIGNKRNIKENYFFDSGEIYIEYNNNKKYKLTVR